MFCKNCGKKLEDGELCCPACGTPSERVNVTQEETEEVGKNTAGENPNTRQETTNQTVNQNTYQQNAYPNAAAGTYRNQQTMYQNPPQQMYPGGFSGFPIRDYDPYMDYNPVGMWGYFWYSILFVIPFIGFIFLLVFSFGGTRNINLRNYARSKFCILIIVAVVLLLFLLLYAAMAV